MKLSIIIPVYHVEATLDRCVGSVLSQSFADFEVILIDDGSPDRCPEMCDQWAEKDSRVSVIHRENGGLSAARNSGFGYLRLPVRLPVVIMYFPDSAPAAAALFAEACVSRTGAKK